MVSSNLNNRAGEREGKEGEEGEGLLALFNRQQSLLPTNALVLEMFHLEHQTGLVFVQLGVGQHGLFQLLLKLVVFILTTTTTTTTVLRYSRLS